MEKKIFPILFLSLCLLLTGCSQEAGAPSPSGEEPSERENAEQAALPFVIEERRESGNFTTTYTDPESGEEKIYPSVEYTYSLPRFTVTQEEEEETLKEAAEVFNQRVDEFFQEALSNLEPTISYDQDENIAPHEPYTDQISYQAYCTEGLVSLQLDFSYYLGGAHGNQASQEWLFDVTKAQFIQPLDLAEDPEALSQAVAQELLQQIQEAGIAEDLWPEYEELIRDWAEKADAVYFHQEGLTITYSPYNLAAYAYGAQVFQVSPEVYQELLSDSGRKLLGLEQA